MKNKYLYCVKDVDGGEVIDYVYLPGTIEKEFDYIYDYGLKLELIEVDSFDSVEDFKKRFEIP